jgi:predicted AlkP superfamily phosphohydrolase/phosphomutase
MIARLLPQLALLTFITACGRHTASGPNSGTPQIIVLGIDGMDPKFVEAHFDALPNLRALVRDGEFKRLGTTIPPQSPVAWSTFITGLDPGGHGIHGFLHRDPETALPFSSLGEVKAPKRTLPLGPFLLPLSAGGVTNIRKGRPFWDILASRGVPTTILRMPTNFPPHECEGEALAGMGTPDLRGTFGTFSFFTNVPGEESHSVSGGEIHAVQLAGGHVTIQLPGPVNSLRKDAAPTYAPIEVDVTANAALIRGAGPAFILKQGEWSDWRPITFPLVPGLATAHGIVRIYAKQLTPHFQFYISPINIDPTHPDLPLSHPGEYSAQLAQRTGLFDTIGMPEATSAYRQGVFTKDEYVAQSKLVTADHWRLFETALDGFHSGLLFFHYFGVDQDSHMLWGKDDAALLDTYRSVDSAIGRIRSRRPNAHLIVMSDHGFNRFDRAVHLNSWLRHEGYLTLNKGAQPNDEELFANVDWTRTRAYALDLNSLYINLEGREEHGTVAPVEADALLAEITTKLLALRDSETNSAPIDTIYRARDAYHGPEAAHGPDLLIGYALGYRASWQTVLGAVPPALIEPNRDAWVGDHCIAARLVPGVLISNRKSKKSDPWLADLTVSLLALFGASPEPGMVGTSIY